MEKILEQIKIMTDEAHEGNLNELQVFINLKKIKDLAVQCQNELRESAWNETLKYSEKTFEFNGFKVTKSQKTTWSYKHLEDWNKAKAILTVIETRSKQAYLLNDKVIVDQDTGEIHECAHKKVSDVIKVELIKK